MKKNAMILCLALMSVVTMAAKRQKSYDVAAYLYPAYVSDDPRLRPFWPLGMGEWETVMTMQQRHPAKRPALYSRQHHHRHRLLNQAASIRQARRFILTLQ